MLMGTAASGERIESTRADKWTEAEATMLRELWFEGYSYSAIAFRLARHFGFVYTRNAVSAKRKRLGLPKRPTLVVADDQPTPPATTPPRPRKQRPAPPSRLRRKLTPAQRADLIERVLQLREKKRGVNRIAAECGVSRTFVTWHCALNGVFPYGVRRLAERKVTGMYTTKGRRWVTAGEDAEMVRMSTEGLTPTEIAARTGRSVTTVRYRLIVCAAVEEMRHG